jgi:hypothetical protein
MNLLSPFKSSLEYIFDKMSLRKSARLAKRQEEEEDDYADKLRSGKEHTVEASSCVLAKKVTCSKKKHLLDSQRPRNRITHVYRHPF